MSTQMPKLINSIGDKSIIYRDGNPFALVTYLSEQSLKENNFETPVYLHWHLS